MSTKIRTPKVQTSREARYLLLERCERFKEKALRPAKQYGPPPPYDAAVYEALFGSDYRLPKLLGSDIRAREKLAGILYGRLRALYRSDPALAFWHTTIVDGSWLTNDQDTTIRLSDMWSKAEPALSGLMTNYIAFAEIQPFANLSQFGRPGKLLTLHTHAIGWGAQSLTQEQARRDWNQHFKAIVPGLDSVVVQRAGVGGKVRSADIARIIGYDLKLPCFQKTVFRNPETGKANFHQSEAGDRYIRFNRLFEILSMINLGRLVRGGGEGATILEDVAVEMMAWAKEEQDPAVIRIDQIAEFWLTQRVKRKDHRRFTPPVII